jgi:hypothetical protein
MEIIFYENRNIMNRILYKVKLSDYKKYEKIYTENNAIW